MEMDREEFIWRLVLNWICDDYENIDQVILPEVAKIGARLGWTIERAEIVDALAKLIEQGMAKAYLLSRDTVELDGMPAVDVVEEELMSIRLLAGAAVLASAFAGAFVAACGEAISEIAVTSVRISLASFMFQRL